MQTLTDPSCQRPRALIVDDNENTVALFEALLASWGCDCETADNGAVAVEKATTTAFDLILMDYMMPAMNGIDATNNIRRGETRLGWHAPIILHSVYPVDELDKRCRQADLDGYLVKPLNLTAVERTVKSALKRSRDLRTRLLFAAIKPTTVH
ncbi:MAG: response regulator [Alphaproteobacteria bacterium]|nr:response regulator [Alphaproteobacteria bacterium]